MLSWIADARGGCQWGCSAHETCRAPAVGHWSLTTLREKLIKIGAKVVTTARHVIFQMAEVAVPRKLFRSILDRIRRLREPTWVPG